MIFMNILMIITQAQDLKAIIIYYLDKVFVNKTSDEFNIFKYTLIVSIIHFIFFYFINLIGLFNNTWLYITYIQYYRP